HEAGLSIAHSGYHRHTAYILANADMPGFSRSEQQLLAMFGLGHHGKLNRPELQTLDDEQWRALLCLRLAAVLLRRREDFEPAPLTLSANGKHFRANVSSAWLEAHPLTEYSLRAEQEEWSKRGFQLDFVET
nr:exopolyphosphatase [Pseudomonas sp.]